jgi:hypothetical protein
MNHILSIEEAIKLSGLCRATLLHHLAKGRFDAVKIGKTFAVDPASFVGFLRKHNAGTYKVGRPSKAGVTKP